MKSSMLLLALIAAGVAGCSKDTGPAICSLANYYYYQHAPLQVGELSDTYIVVFCNLNYSDGDLKNYLGAKKYLDQNYKYTIITGATIKVIALRLNSPKNCEEINLIIYDLQQNPGIAYANYAMEAKDCLDAFGQPMGSVCVQTYNGYFYVEVFNKNELTGLQAMVAKTGSIIVEQSTFSPRFFLLRTTKNSSGNSLQTANYFHESGLFKSSQPEISKISVEP